MSTPQDREATDIAAEKAAVFLADMARAGLTPAESLALALAYLKPTALLTPDDLDLFERFEALFAGTEAGATCGT